VNAGTFSLQASPLPVNGIPKGTTTSSTITVTPSGGFTGSVTLTVTGLPNGSSATFNPATVNINDAFAQTSTLSIKTSNGTKAGTYTLTVTPSGGVAPVTLTLKVN
jgi:hypothetical protein